MQSFSSVSKFSMKIHGVRHPVHRNGALENKISKDRMVNV